MPGKNSAFDRSKYNSIELIFTTNVYRGIIFFVILVEVYGVGRYYTIWDDLRFSFEAFSLTTFLILCDIQVFKGLYKAKDEDPGY